MCHLGAAPTAGDERSGGEAGARTHTRASLRTVNGIHDGEDESSDFTVGKEHDRQGER